MSNIEEEMAAKSKKQVVDAKFFLVLVDESELNLRREQLDNSFLRPESQTPWQDIFREKVNPLSEGMTLKGAEKHKNIAAFHVPRDNH